jgi:DMSO/TMAO reductase YedYZ molybdopterin-dependent catalytic subunit
MTQPDTGARKSSEREQDSPAARETDPLAAGRANGGLADAGLAGGGRANGGPVGGGLADAGPGDTAERGSGGSLPPGQYIPRTLPVLHYGPIPAFRQDSWDLRIFGATASGDEARLSWHDVQALPASEITADFHCVTKFTVPDLRWSGVLATDLLCKFPPAEAATHAMIWADFGYSANIRISDFAADDTILATHRDSEPLSPEHGFPLRLVVPTLYAWKSVKWVRAIEYLTVDRRGFWEERGYHNVADPWREQRYSYQELDGEGPPL